MAYEPHSPPQKYNVVGIGEKAAWHYADMAEYPFRRGGSGSLERMTESWLLHEHMEETVQKAYSQSLMTA